MTLNIKLPILIRCSSKFKKFNFFLFRIQYVVEVQPEIYIFFLVRDKCLLEFFSMHSISYRVHRHSGKRTAPNAAIVHPLCKRDISAQIKIYIKSPI